MRFSDGVPRAQREAVVAAAAEEVGDEGAGAARCPSSSAAQRVVGER